MARVKGNTQPVLTFKVGTASAVDFGSEVVSVEFADGDASQTTMSDYASGSAPKNLNVTFVLDFAAEKSFQWFTANAGATNVAYTYTKDGGTATGTLTLPAKPGFAVSAGTDDATYDVSMVCDSYAVTGA